MLRRIIKKTFHQPSRSQGKITDFFKSDIFWILTMFVLWRLSLTVWVGLIGANQPILPVDSDVLDPIIYSYREAQPFVNSIAQFTLDPWYRWDAGWYISMALGQQDGMSGFAPLYPALIRLFTPFSFDNPMLAALLVSNIFFLVALWLLFNYVNDLLGLEKARLAVLLLMLFPFSVFFASAYSESLFLCLTLAAFTAINRERWEWVGIWIILAIMTRFSGVVLMVPLVWETIKAIILDKPSKWLAVGSTVLIPVIMIIYMGFSLNTASSRFSQTISWPWESIKFFWYKSQAGTMWVMDWVNLLLLIICIFSLFFMIKRLPTIDWLYAGSNLAILLVVKVNESFLVFGLTRYVLVIFPFFIVWADWLLDKRWLKPIVLVTGYFAQLGIAWLYTRWYFVG